MSKSRFSKDQMKAWRRDGAVVIPDFFTPEEVAAVVADFEAVFGKPEHAGEELNKKGEGVVGRFHPSQFKDIQPIPIDCSPALNLIGVHPALIAFAKQALETDDVRVYQCQSWAKFTGDSDYDQPFHTDFSNHTLTVPSEDAAKNSITILCYFSDVTDAHGAMHFVTRPDANSVGADPELSLSRDPVVHAKLQTDLVPLTRSSASTAGTAIPYTIDIYHRGTNLTAPKGHRYALMTCFRKAHDDAIQFTAWAFHHTKPWQKIFENATTEQLAVFGVPRPGDPFWTETTIARAQMRYPGWDLTPYRKALAKKKPAKRKAAARKNARRVMPAKRKVARKAAKRKRAA
ncbi:MAG: phytanoyl-CoA dioxygenase family protein [Alphaproteobacteria bacterium]|nr:phytanoyl-CoA dioxygenase family protein [Alphaproteobacteria bacterium]MBL6937363.1 phytanoyl-CoA dioxygenase family protein [Alphaproteobacteria bacterium]MBL7096075.1 phytanoyl-CoA dioxygenase family protein [Alphaproteobacteria bacterium]